MKVKVNTIVAVATIVGLIGYGVIAYKAISQGKGNEEVAKENGHYHADGTYHSYEDDEEIANEAGHYHADGTYHAYADGGELTELVDPNDKEAGHYHADGTYHSYSDQEVEDEEKQGIIDMLSEQGIDKDKLETAYESENGATILGDAKPAHQYKSLHDAETAFGYYLGLHNSIDSLKGYNLVDLHIINNEFLQGNYMNEDSTKSIVVKTSKTLDVKELTSVYSGHEYESYYEIQGVTVDVAGENKDILNLASFRASNKSYAINTVAGLSSEDMNKLLNELISNLKGMDDWSE